MKFKHTCNQHLVLIYIQLFLPLKGHSLFCYPAELFTLWPFSACFYKWCGVKYMCEQCLYAVCVCVCTRTYLLQKSCYWCLRRADRTEVSTYLMRGRQLYIPAKYGVEWVMCEHQKLYIGWRISYRWWDRVTMHAPGVRIQTIIYKSLLNTSSNKYYYQVTSHVTVMLDYDEPVKQSLSIRNCVLVVPVI